MTGNSEQDSVVAIIVPSLDCPEVHSACKGDLTRFVHKAESVDLVMDQINAAGINAKLKVCPPQSG